jgi:hypothetical protein
MPQLKKRPHKNDLKGLLTLIHVECVVQGAMGHSVGHLLGASALLSPVTLGIGRTPGARKQTASRQRLSIPRMASCFDLTDIHSLFTRTVPGTPPTVVLLPYPSQIFRAAQVPTTSSAVEAAALHIALPQSYPHHLLGYPLQRPRALPQRHKRLESQALLTNTIKHVSSSRSSHHTHLPRPPSVCRSSGASAAPC